MKADYGNIVAKANPTGLLPTWNKWIDKAQAKKLGLHVQHRRRRRRLLAAAGYKDTNGDGYVENKDGSTINLELIVPNGWSDWMTAIQIIAASAKDAGIKITPAFPDYNGLVDERNAGKFDLRDQQRQAARQHAVHATTTTSSTCRSPISRRSPTTRASRHAGAKPGR